jgi:low molecular weight protein-tyrosine phosphatase
MGNICRSPTAEGVMAKLLAGDPRITIDSAGTGAWHIGELPDERARAAAARRGITLEHRARQFTRADLASFDLVVAMDNDNLRHLRKLAGSQPRPEIRLLRDFDPDAPPGAEVPDPYYGDAGFEHVLDLCERACAGLLAYARSKLR